MKRPDGIHRSGLLLLLCWLGLGCAKNAILEVEIELPSNPDHPAELFALTQVRAADVGFSELWSAAQDPPGIPLGPGPTVDQISVEATDEDLDANVRIRFCKEARCTAIGDDQAPEVRLWIEHPFYIGSRTFWSFTVEEVPSGPPPEEPLRIDRCEIRGCVAGDESSTYCRMDGRHLCE